MPLKENPKDAAEHLAEMTGRSQSEFEPDADIPMLGLDDLEWETLDDDESPFTDE